MVYAAVGSKWKGESESEYSDWGLWVSSSVVLIFCWWMYVLCTFCLNLDKKCKHHCVSFLASISWVCPRLFTFQLVKTNLFVYNNFYSAFPLLSIFYTFHLFHISWLMVFQCRNYPFNILVRLTLWETVELHTQLGMENIGAMLLCC